MTQPCDACGTPSDTPTCPACRASQLGQTEADRRHADRLARTKQFLTELPTFVAILTRCATEKPAPDGNTESASAPVVARPPVRLDVVHLTDTHEKPLWWGEDPRAAELGDRYGVAYALHAWSRVVWEEQPDAAYLAETPTVDTECAYLIAAWDWITAQRWAGALCDDVAGVVRRCQTALGVRTQHQPRCRYCGDVVEPVDTTHETTNWQSYAYALCRGCGWKYEPGVELRALGQVQPAKSIRDLSDTTGIPQQTLYRWAERGAIVPAPESPKRPSSARPALYDLAAVQAVAARLSRRTA